MPTPEGKEFWVIPAMVQGGLPSGSDDLEEAKKRGYHLHFGDSAPTENTRDGLPVLWVQGKPQDLIPVIPQIPAFHLGHRKVAIPDNQPGVQYYLNGQAVEPGIHSVPGEGFTIFRVKAEPKPGYTTTGKYEWIRTISSPEGRELWVSDKAALRPAGQELNPPVPGTTSGDDNHRYGHFKPRQGEPLNNGFGGYGTAHFYQLGVGWAKLARETEWVHSSWKISDHNTYMEQHLDSMTVLLPHTRNLTVEFDFIPSRTKENQEAITWVGATQDMYGFEFGFRILGKNVPGEPREGRIIPKESREGTWKVEIVNDIFTLTAPNGWSITQDHSEKNGKEGRGGTGLFGIRLNTNEMSGFRVYKRRDEGVNNA